MTAASTSAKRKRSPSAEPSLFVDAVGTEMVDIYVGTEKKHYHVHKSLLCRKIPYFDRIFRGNFQEAATNQAEFPKDDSVAFDILVGWIYKDTIRELKFDRERQCCNFDPYAAYCLADKFCLPQLMDCVMSAILEVETRDNLMPGVSVSKDVYEKSPEGSPIRRYVAQAWHHIISTSASSDKSWRVQLQELIKIEDFSRDFIYLMHGQGGVIPKDPRCLPRCNFHHHGKEEECPLKQTVTK